jgi:arsenate reductase
VTYVDLAKRLKKHGFSVNPFALRALESLGYPTDGMRSKSWMEFAAADAPVMDFVFTVCDSAAASLAPFGRANR